MRCVYGDGWFAARQAEEDRVSAAGGGDAGDAGGLRDGLRPGGTVDRVPPPPPPPRGFFSSNFTLGCTNLNICVCPPKKRKEKEKKKLGTHRCACWLTSLVAKNFFYARNSAQAGWAIALCTR